MTQDAPAKPRQARLFDKLPIDDFVVNFSGRIPLEAGNEMDMKLRDGSLLGHRLRIEVDVLVAAKGAKVKRNKEGGIEDVVETLGLKIDSITIEGWEDLGVPA